MTLTRIGYDQGALVDFYQEALDQLGAVCERTWFDHLQVVAEGTAARLWNAEGTFTEVDLQFSAPETTVPRDASVEVFPGCPLTFRLAELLRPEPIPLEQVVLGHRANSSPPALEVAGKLWHLQRPGASRWRCETAFTPAHHFSLVTLVRCEIQAIDQHWSLHRLALSLPDGELDDTLASELDFLEVAAAPPRPVIWPTLPTSTIKDLLTRALTLELESELKTIRTRQENQLSRELARVDDYFTTYAAEVNERAARRGKDSIKLKTAERLAAARAEHERRRADQVQRHAIRVIPYFDALLIVAEEAWQARVTEARAHEVQTRNALFVPRCRRWFIADASHES